MNSTAIPMKSSILQWDTDAVVNWLHQSNLGAFEHVFRENEIDGSVLLKLSESMVARLFPTIKLEVQFLELLQQLKQQHSIEINPKKPLPPPSLITSRSSNPHSSRTSSFENGHERSSNSNSPTSNNNNHSHSATKVQKREPKHFLNQLQINGYFPSNSNENNTKHIFPHVYKLPQFPETLRLALASQDSSAFKLRTYYRNLLISSIYDDLTRTYNLWYPNARQYKTVAAALVKAYPFLESSSDGGESAWIDGIKGKFKRGRRILTSHFDAAQDNGAENSDEEILEESCSQKRSRHEFDEKPLREQSRDISKKYPNFHSTQSDISDDESSRSQYRLAMQKTHSSTNEFDPSMLEHFKETFLARRSFVKTHNTNEILTEYPALRIHSCLLADFYMQTNISIQTVLISKLRAISKRLIHLAKETDCAREILHSYHAIISQRPHLEQIVADTFAVMIIACYFGEEQFLLISPETNIQSPWPVIRGHFPARAFLDEHCVMTYNIELDYIQLFRRPLNDFLTAISALYATYSVFEITYGKLEMTLAFLDGLLRDNFHPSTYSPAILELIDELNSLS